MNFDWLLSDFETVVPIEARGLLPRRGQWQVVDYTTDTLTGKMIYANPETGAPPIRIALPLVGTYEIVVAMREDLCDEVKIKLATDSSFDRIAYSFRGQSSGTDLQEVVWRTLNLDGTQELIVKESPGFRLGIGFIAARKAVAKTEFPKQYLLHLADDGYPGLWNTPEDDADTVWPLPPYRSWGADYLSFGSDLSGMASYPSKHASLRIPVEELHDIMPVKIHTWEEILTSVTYRRLIDDDALDRNVPRLTFALARELGIEAFAYSRMCHLPGVAPFNAIPTRLPLEHPEYRCIDIDGIPVARLSMAFAEVRAEYLKLFTECIEMGARGISNVFNRGVPVVLYEQQILDAFREKYNADARDFAENDPRIQAVRAAFVTNYMREQRQAIDAAGNGEKVTIAVSLPATGTTCDFYGLDIAAWVREGLVDMVMPYPFAIDATVEAIDMNFFCAVVDGSSVKLLPYVNTWHNREPVSFLQSALRLAEYPIDGFSVWDPMQLPVGWRSVDFARAIASLGSIEAINDCIKNMETDMPIRHAVRTQQGMKVDKYSYGWNY